MEKIILDMTRQLRPAVEEKSMIGIYYLKCWQFLSESSVTSNQHTKMRIM